MPFASTWMQLEIVILSEESQKEKDKYHMIITYMCAESKIWYKWTYIWNRNTDIETRLVVAKGEGVGEEWIGSLGLADANWYI